MSHTPLAFPIGSQQTFVYVSKTGNDATNDGSRDSPYLTIARALADVSNLGSSRVIAGAGGGITVGIRLLPDPTDYAGDVVTEFAGCDFVLPNNWAVPSVTGSSSLLPKLLLDIDDDGKAGFAVGDTRFIELAALNSIGASAPPVGGAEFQKRFHKYELSPGTLTTDQYVGDSVRIFRAGVEKIRGVICQAIPGGGPPNDEIIVLTGPLDNSGGVFSPASGDVLRVVKPSCSISSTGLRVAGSMNGQFVVCNLTIPSFNTFAFSENITLLGCQLRASSASFRTEGVGGLYVGSSSALDLTFGTADPAFGYDAEELRKWTDWPCSFFSNDNSGSATLINPLRHTLLISSFIKCSSFRPVGAITLNNSYVFKTRIRMEEGTLSGQNLVFDGNRTGFPVCEVFDRGDIDITSDFFVDASRTKGPVFEVFGANLASNTLTAKAFKPGEVELAVNSSAPFIRVRAKHANHGGSTTGGPKPTSVAISSSNEILSEPSGDDVYLADRSTGASFTEIAADPIVDVNNLIQVTVI